MCKETYGLYRKDVRILTFRNGKKYTKNWFDFKLQKHF